MDNKISWKKFDNDAYSLEYPSNWDISTTLESELSDDIKYLGDSVHLKNPNKTFGVSITNGELSYGGTGEEFYRMIWTPINGKQHKATEELRTNAGAARTSTHVKLNNKDYFVMFATGYPLTDEYSASIDDYNANRVIALKILSTVKFK